MMTMMSDRRQVMTTRGCLTRVSLVPLLTTTMSQCGQLGRETATLALDWRLGAPV